MARAFQESKLEQTEIMWRKICFLLLFDVTVTVAFIFFEISPLKIFQCVELGDVNACQIREAAFLFPFLCIMATINAWALFWWVLLHPSRPFKTLLLSNAAICLTLIIYINPYHMYQCGHFGYYSGPNDFSASPKVGLGLHAYWWRSYFDFTDGRKLRLFSSPYDEPPIDPFVKGRELYDEIIAYAISEDEDELFLKATDWRGEEKTYRAQMHPKSTTRSHLFQVTEYGGADRVRKWVKVDYWSCRGGILWFGSVFLAFLIGLFSAIIMTLWGVFWLSERRSS